MKAGLQFFFVTICLMLGAACAKAQIYPDTAMTRPVPPIMRYRADTMERLRDSLPPPPKPMPFQPVPKRAGLYSAIIPGMGQVYNRQYWKVPIVYAALGAGGVVIGYNLKQYRHYRKAYVTRVDFDPNNNNSIEDSTYSTEALRQLEENYRKDLDVSILVTGILYAAQVLDAITSAHLKNFDVSRDISMQMRPVVDPRGIGFGLVMNFK